MTKKMTPEEQRTREWLEERGYVAEYEPEFIPAGEPRPDFWAEAPDGDPSQLWVEVKKIDQDASSAVMSMAVKVERATRFPEGLCGEALMGVNEDSKEPAVRSVIRLFREHAPRYAHERTTLAFVQHGLDDRILRRAEILTPQGIERLWARGQATGPLACPYNFCDDEPYRDVTWWDANGDRKVAKAYEVLAWTDDCQCSLTVCLDPSGSAIETFGISSHGAPNIPQRTVRLLEKANTQLRSAVSLRPAPAIAVLVPYFDYVEDQLIQAGCYGVLKVPIDVKTGVFGDTYHGEDGVFRPTKNRHISAAIRLWKNGTATYFPNPYARHKIDESAALFAGLNRAKVSFRVAG